MKSFSIFICLLAFTTQLYSQELKNEAVIGTWKVVDCQIIPEVLPKFNNEQKKDLEQMRLGFAESIFNLEKNGQFTLRFNNRYSKFMKDLEILNNAYWKIVKGKSIVVGNKEDHYSQLEINIMTKNEKKYFYISEAFFILEVIHEKN